MSEGAGKRPTGRPTKLTPEVQESICAKLAQGRTAEASAALAGISESSFYGWLERGRQEPDSIYAGFLEAVKRAEAEFEDHALNRLDADEKGWQRYMTWLERRKPKLWGQQKTVHHEGGEVPLKVVHAPSMAPGEEK